METVGLSVITLYAVAAARRAGYGRSGAKREKCCSVVCNPGRKLKGDGGGMGDGMLVTEVAQTLVESSKYSKREDFSIFEGV